MVVIIIFYYSEMRLYSNLARLGRVFKLQYLRATTIRA